MPLYNSVVQRCLAIGVSNTNISTLREERFDLLDIAVGRCLKK